jgi:hypothetical protein
MKRRIFLLPLCASVIFGSAAGQSVPEQVKGYQFNGVEPHQVLQQLQEADPEDRIKLMQQYQQSEQQRQQGVQVIRLDQQHEESKAIGKRQEKTHYQLIEPKARP